MRIVPQERFVLVEPIDQEVSIGNRIYVASTSEDYVKYRVVSLGKEAEDSGYLIPSDIILVQKKDVNEIKYDDKIFYLVSIGFTIKIEE